jgi:thioredoxin 1
MNTIIIVITIIILIGLFWFYVKHKIKNIPLATDHQNIIILTDKNFRQEIKNKTILVDFWAAWCAPCRVMAPVLNQLASELNGEKHVGKVDIQQYQSLAQEFKIRSIPTLILFKNGKEINRFVGIKNKDFLMKQL